MKKRAIFISLTLLTIQSSKMLNADELDEWMMIEAEEPKIDDWTMIERPSQKDLLESWVEIPEEPWMIGGQFKELTKDEINKLTSEERTRYYEQLYKATQVTHTVEEAKALAQDPTKDPETLRQTIEFLQKDKEHQTRERRAFFARLNKVYPLRISN